MKSAQVAIDQKTHEEIVGFTLNHAGARMLGDFTNNNVEKTIAIVLDGSILNTVVIRQPILGGSGQISGIQAIGAKALSIQLRSGRLPASFTVVEERLINAQ